LHCAAFRASEATTPDVPIGDAAWLPWRDCDVAAPPPRGLNAPMHAARVSLAKINGNWSTPNREGRVVWGITYGADDLEGYDYGSLYPPGRAPPEQGAVSPPAIGAVQASSSVGDAQLPSAVVGDWQGNVRQGRQTYPVSLSVVTTVPDTTAGTISYPSLKCGGSLKFLGRVGDDYLFREALEFGNKVCGDGGIVVLGNPSTQASFGWVRSWPSPTPSEVSGTLARQ
jgi:hypothetical protein